MIQDIQKKLKNFSSHLQRRWHVWLHRNDLIVIKNDVAHYSHRILKKMYAEGNNTMPFNEFVTTIVRKTQGASAHYYGTYGTIHTTDPTKPSMFVLR